MNMNNRDITSLNKIASIIRGKIIEVSSLAEIPHLGSCLSCVDILVALYNSILNIDPKDPENPHRDRFILSKGHAAPALFQILAMKKFFAASWLDTYGQDGTLLGEHALAHGIPGIEAATGSLGHGLPIGTGLALGAKVKGIQNQVFVLMSDGECNEGSVWEAAMFAAAQNLTRLNVIIDFNKWQATGRSEEIMALNPLVDKWRSFGWEAIEIDGHDMNQIIHTLSQSKQHQKPYAMIAHTIKGKGVSFMEDDNNWHYRIPTSMEVLAAKQELGLIEEVHEECIRANTD
jgi:transketolase